MLHTLRVNDSRRGPSGPQRRHSLTHAVSAARTNCCAGFRWRRYRVTVTDKNKNKVVHTRTEALSRHACGGTVFFSFLSLIPRIFINRQVMPADTLAAVSFPLPVDSGINLGEWETFPPARAERELFSRRRPFFLSFFSFRFA